MKIRLAKKEDVSTPKAVAIRVGAVIIAIALSGLIILLMGHDPFETFEAMIKGSLGSSYGIRNTITVAVPLLVIGLGLSVAFSMKFWNIGGEGQLVMGAIWGTYAAHQMPDSISPWLALPLVGLASIAGGAFWAVIPGFFRAFSRTNETLFTLMLNYVAIKFTVYLRCELWKDPEAKGFPQIAPLPDSAHLPKLFGIHIGWIVALILVVMVHLFLRYSKLGYEIRVVGESERTAHYAGINVRKVIITGTLISGALVGLAGMLKLTGVSWTLSESIGGGNGFTAVMVAWLAQLQAPVMIITSLLFAVMEQGSMAMEISVGVPASVSKIIEGLILFAALSSDLFIRYRVVAERKSSAACSSDNTSAVIAGNGEGGTK
ncbi:MAG: ABC transporter permease [Eubacteriales bacterium]|nr:ABC transporter permease [Eubacteriales bacterium]MDD4682823.1 ABC transporter permease [Eubacteriales bacterium]